MKIPAAVLGAAALIAVLGGCAESGDPTAAATSSTARPTTAPTTTTAVPTTTPPPTTTVPTTVPPPPAPPPAPVAAPAPAQAPAPRAAKTTTRAPAPQPRSACDPNYTGCVPVDSDVDCAGGSGNGPSYVAGPVRVIGSDIYGLDRDGDGIACE